MSTKEKAASFSSQVLAHMNKDEKQVQKEFVEDTIEDYIVKCEGQISIINVTEIPTLKIELKAAKRVLTKSKSQEKEGILDLKGGDFSEFVSTLNVLENDVLNANDDVARINSEIKVLEAKAKKFQTLLDRLNS